MSPHKPRANDRVTETPVDWCPSAVLVYSKDGSGGLVCSKDGSGGLVCSKDGSGGLVWGG